jgi:hypothetical protein
MGNGVTINCQQNYVNTRHQGTSKKLPSKTSSVDDGVSCLILDFVSELL